METVGQYLRQQREEKQISLDTVMLQTRIQIGFLEAIEGDRFDEIPHGVSTKGFIRSYAQFLQLDPVKTLERFSSFLPEAVPLKQPDFYKDPSVYMGQIGSPSPSQTALYRFFKKSLKGVLIILGLVLFLVWLSYSNRVLPPTPSEREQNVLNPAPKLSLPKAQPVAVPVPEMNPKQLSMVPSIAPVIRQGSPLIPDPSPRVSASETASLSHSTPSSGTMTETPPPDPLLPLSPSLIEKPIKIQNPLILALEAEATTWVKIVIDSRTTKDVLLQQGDKVAWEASDRFLVTVGNAGGVRAFFNGQNLGILGSTGEVIRDRLFMRPSAEGKPQPIERHEPF